ncbi:MAG: YceI family protein [Candidatus Marinimicrobia bacterium]|jgi:polyisoprenoid-binding protein YceI|nr:YceI family protein [Candidatus Neomarinimicrobiota bacterium]MBT7515081.1 YceI family protein [Candidatus Neomarinimicrobiota bacterium]MBT7945576.1 YceI family protein [Candidatus Neomarinimicrobiota bacterium]
MKKFIFGIFCFSFLIAGNGKMFTVDVENTSLRWEGVKVTGSHWGYVTMQDGSVNIEGRTILSGDFTVTLNSMTEDGMGESPWKAKLLNHLKSDDFFDVANHPTAHLKLTSAVYNNGAFSISGDLTIRGMTHPIEFPAVIQFSDKGPKATGQIKIDRTLYGMKYKSGKFFPEIGDKMIYDEFTLDFEVKSFTSKSIN